MLQVVITGKFCRMRNGCQFQTFTPFHRNIVFNQLLWEYASCSQIFVICFQCIQGGIQ